MAEQPHVLVVDDDAKIAAALRRALIYEGYQVEVAPDGHIALARARDRMPDLAILDIMMPGIDGLEVTRRLRAEGDVPILLLTARDGMADRGCCKRCAGLGTSLRRNEPSIGDRVRVAERLTPIRRSLIHVWRWLDLQTALRRRLPIRGRIALFGAVVVAVTVVIFSGLVYVVVQRSLVTQQDGVLQRGGDRAWTVLASGGRVLPGRNFFPPDLNNSSEPFYELFDSQGTPYISSAVIDGVFPQMPSGALESVPADRGVFRNVQPSGGPLVRAYVRAWNRPDLGVSGYVLYGQPLFGIQAQLDALRLFLIAGVFLSLLGAGAASWLVAGRALRPLDSMATTAEDIGRTQDLSRRIPESGPNDEVCRF